MKPFIYWEAFIRLIVMLLGIQIRMLFVRVVAGDEGAVWRKVVRVFFRVQGLTATIRSSNEPTCVWGLSIEKPGSLKFSAVSETLRDTTSNTPLLLSGSPTLPCWLCIKI
jgi:hypothetical protein